MLEALWNRAVRRYAGAWRAGGRLIVHGVLIEGAMIYEILQDKFGAPKNVFRDGLEWSVWNEDQEDLKCELLRTGNLCAMPSLERIYARHCGGSVFGHWGRLATTGTNKLYGLYRLDDLNELPHLAEIRRRRPSLYFFMDAANVWYYGVDGDELFVFDYETEEFDSLGELSAGLRAVIDEWR